MPNSVLPMEPRCRMGTLVVLEEGIHAELPVHPLGPGVAAAMAVAAEPVGRELRPEGAERRIEVERACGVEQQPDQAVPLLCREAHQPLLAHRDVGEVLAGRLRPEHAAAVIGPVVIGAGESLADMARAVEQAGAAVAAGVEQALDRAVVAAHQQHRHAGDVEGRGSRRGRRSRSRRRAAAGGGGRAPPSPPPARPCRCSACRLPSRRHRPRGARPRPMRSSASVARRRSVSGCTEILFAAASCPY